MSDYNPNSKASKANLGKLRLSLIPPEALMALGRALSYGEKKYAAHNWRKGLSYSELVDAALRHLTAFMGREEADPESGLSHIDHALASLAMLSGMMAEHPELDDRYRSLGASPVPQPAPDPSTKVDAEVEWEHPKVGERSALGWQWLDSYTADWKPVEKFLLDIKVETPRVWRRPKQKTDLAAEQARFALKLESDRTYDATRSGVQEGMKVYNDE